MMLTVPSRQLPSRLRTANGRFASGARRPTMSYQCWRASSKEAVEGPDAWTLQRGMSCLERCNSFLLFANETDGFAMLFRRCTRRVKRSICFGLAVHQSRRLDNSAKEQDRLGVRQRAMLQSLVRRNADGITLHLRSRKTMSNKHGKGTARPFARRAASARTARATRIAPQDERESEECGSSREGLGQMPAMRSALSHHRTRSTRVRGEGERERDIWSAKQVVTPRRVGKRVRRTSFSTCVQEQQAGCRRVPRYLPTVCPADPSSSGGSPLPRSLSSSQPPSSLPRFRAVSETTSESERTKRTSRR